MPPYPGPEEATDALLSRIAGQLGSPVPEPLRSALRAVPRHLFLPPTVWLRDGNGGYERCDRESDPARWWHAAYEDTPLVTRFTESAHPGGESTPSSSASMPSVVVRMLLQLAAEPGHRVLEIGTGTGFNAALLAQLLGPAHVTSLDIDPGLVHQARQAMEWSGHRPKTVVCSDGAEGWQPNAPYDRVLSTCAVRAVPPAWLEQTVPGGLIVTPWYTSWCNFGTLIATKQADGSATGHLLPYGSFMLMSAERTDVELHRDVLRDAHVPERSVTRLSPWSVAGDDLGAQVYIGLRAPGAWHAWDTDVSGAPAAHTRLWLADEEASSWARVDYDGRQTETFAVAQYGPRRLWDEVARAHAAYEAAGSPAIERHALRITPQGAGTRLQVVTAGERPLPAPPHSRT